MHSLKKNTKILLTCLFFALLSVFFLFLNLGKAPLVDWDEALYANISGEMVERGEYGFLYLQGEKWLEKEPLPFWLMAISLKMFGFHVFGVRFMAALLGVLVAPLFFLIAVRWFGLLISVLITLLFFFSPPFWASHMLRTGDFDVMLLVLFLLAVVLYLSFRESQYFWLAAVAVAFSLLTRGVMGGLLLFFLLGSELRMVWLAKRGGFLGRTWKWQQIGQFVLISILPWIAWHLWLWANFRIEYLDIYWKEQFFGRISSPLQGHSGGWGYYVDYWWKEFGYFFIFILFCMFFVVSTAVGKNKPKASILAWWLVITLVPLHLMKTKLSWYGIIVLPAMWLSVGYTIQEAWKWCKKYLITHMKPVSTSLVPRFTLYIVVFALFASISLPWVTQAYEKVHEQPTLEMLQFIKTSSSLLPPKATVIVYRLHQWNFGRLLPAWYWYLHFENGLQPISIGPQNIEHYASREQEYPWWMSDEVGFLEVKKLLGEDHVRVLAREGEYILFRVFQ